MLLSAAKEPEAEVPAGGEQAPPAQAAAEASQQVAAVEGEDLAASVATGNACDHGMVASIGKKAPGCLSACSRSCGPLSQAIGAYMRGGKTAVSKVVCANKRPFACFFEHGSCAPLVAQAKGAGAPGSKGSLYNQCGASTQMLLSAAKQPEAEVPAGGEEAPAAQAAAEASQQVDAAVEGEDLAASVATGNACDHGMVASIGKKAP